MKLNKPILLAILFPAWFLLGMWFGGMEFKRYFATSIIIFAILPSLAYLGYNVVITLAS